MEAYILVKRLKAEKMEQVFKSGQNKEIYWMGKIDWFFIKVEIGRTIN